MNSWDPFEFAPGAATFLAPPIHPTRAAPRRRGFLEGLGGTAAPVSGSDVATYDAVGQHLLAIFGANADRLAHALAAQTTAYGFLNEDARAFAQSVIGRMVNEIRNQNRLDFLNELLAQFERRLSPSSENRSAARRVFEAGVPEAPPLSAFEDIWDKLDRYLKTLGTYGKVAAGLGALYFAAKIAGAVGGGRK